MCRRLLWFKKEEPDLEKTVVSDIVLPVEDIQEDTRTL